MYIDKLDDIVNKYSNTFHRTSFKIKPINVKDNTYINKDKYKEVNDKNPTFKIGDLA